MIRLFHYYYYCYCLFHFFFIRDKYFFTIVETSIAPLSRINLTCVTQAHLAQVLRDDSERFPTILCKPFSAILIEIQVIHAQRLQHSIQRNRSKMAYKGQKVQKVMVQPIVSFSKWLSINRGYNFNYKHSSRSARGYNGHSANHSLLSSRIRLVHYS